MWVEQVDEEADPLLLNKAWISKMQMGDWGVLVQYELLWVAKGRDEAVGSHQVPCHPRSG